MAGLPSPGPAFATKKSKLLAQLSQPAGEYSDASPKGSVDAGIRELIDEINGREGLVTTSSCAGRVSVFVEGSRRGPQPASSVGGKGGGGAWLYVSHEPVGGGEASAVVDVVGLLGLEAGTGAELRSADAGGEEARLIHFKFEPMILHILTASPAHAELVLKAGLQAGYRESGAINLLEGRLEGGSVNPIVAIRSMGLSLESLVGVETGTRRWCIVSSEYLEMLLQISNERFKENEKRIERFRSALEAAQSVKVEALDPRADRELRREIKRAEGLRRQKELRNEGQSQRGETEMRLPPEPETI